MSAISPELPILPEEPEDEQLMYVAVKDRVGRIQELCVSEASVQGYGSVRDTDLTKFNANRAEVFWAKRAAFVRADVIAMKAAAESMEVGHQQSKIIYKQRFAGLEQDGVVEQGEEGFEDESGVTEQPASSSDSNESNDDVDEVQDDLLDSEEVSNECVQALRDNNLRKADIADAMTIIGVFAPFLQTDRMRAIFTAKILGQLVASYDLPDPDIDDAAVLRAVRLRLNNKSEDASEALMGLDRKMRLMFDNLLESLPEEVDKSISEATFTANYVAPVLTSILKVSGKTQVHYSLGDDGARSLYKALKINKTLTTLTLLSNFIEPNGFQALLEALKTNSTLTTLSLYSNKLGSYGTQKLSEALKINGTLTTLSLFGNCIGPNGAQAMSGVLRVNSTLM
ncbi:hypothetical protein BGZ58_000743 [Dissophora ornata]|nr:hypothetical protein BGZ58_000743 [Dissophora ornata]